MYKLQEKPDELAVTKRGEELHPVATLRDEHGGVSHICIDDHCYVLYNGDDIDGVFYSAKHWYREAVQALKNLPLPE